MNMKTGYKVFLTCALGAFVGALVALQMKPFFWWVGLIVGGLTGYLSYDWKQVVEAEPQAAKAAWGGINTDKAKAVFLGLLDVVVYLITFPFRFIGSFFVLLPAALYSGLTVGLWIGTVAPIADLYFHFRASGLLLFAISTLGATALIGLVMAFVFALVTTLANDPLNAGMPVLLAVNPKRDYFRAIALLVIGVSRFAWKLFKLIHSEVRLLCGVDAAIGAAVGYYFHNALLGAVAGGLWGFINYEVLSIRILGLAPKTQSVFSR